MTKRSRQPKLSDLTDGLLNYISDRVRIVNSEWVRGKGGHGSIRTQVIAYAARDAAMAWYALKWNEMRDYVKGRRGAA